MKPDGASVGGVGEFVGLCVGDAVGLRVGEAVGFLVGELVGFLVGELVGFLVGAGVGLLVGFFVGAGVVSLFLAAFVRSSLPSRGTIIIITIIIFPMVICLALRP